MSCHFSQISFLEATARSSRLLLWVAQELTEVQKALGTLSDHEVVPPETCLALQRLDGAQQAVDSLATFLSEAPSDRRIPQNIRDFLVGEGELSAAHEAVVELF